MDTTIQLVRLNLDGRWSADDLGQVLISLSDLYDLRLFLEFVREDQHDWERFYDALAHNAALPRRWKRWMSSASPSWRAQGFRGAPPVLDEARLSGLSALFEPDERLVVRQIRYSSPGFTDLAGIGTVVGHIKEFVVKMIERRDSRRQRELNDERADLENDRLRLENAQAYVALGRELGYSEMDLRILAARVEKRREPLSRLIDQQKLRAVSTPDMKGKGQ